MTAILAGNITSPVFSPVSPWHRRVDSLPISPNSDRIIKFIVDRGPEPEEMPDVAHLTACWGPQHGRARHWVVGIEQPLVPVEFTGSQGYLDSTQRGLIPSIPGYPIPEDAKELYAAGAPDPTGDRILILVNDRWRVAWELGGALWTGKRWEAGVGVTYDLTTGDEWTPDMTTRPIGWTSCSDSGLSCLAGMVRYEEIYATGVIRHAVAGATYMHRGFVPPARHQTPAAPGEEGAPPEGTRLRLKAGYDISKFALPSRVLLTALKLYGIILCDSSGGYDLCLTGSWDKRWPADKGYHFSQQELRTVRVTDFEVVDGR